MSRKRLNTWSHLNASVHLISLYIIIPKTLAVWHPEGLLQAAAAHITQDLWHIDILHDTDDAVDAQ